MDHKVSKDMISSGMIPSGEKTQADLGRIQYGSAPSPSSLMDAYRSIYEHHQKDKDGNTIPHQEDLNEGNSRKEEVEFEKEYITEIDRELTTAAVVGGKLLGKAANLVKQGVRKAGQVGGSIKPKKGFYNVKSGPNTPSYLGLKRPATGGKRTVRASYGKKPEKSLTQRMKDKYKAQTGKDYPTTQKKPKQNYTGGGSVGSGIYASDGGRTSYSGHGETSIKVSGPGQGKPKVGKVKSYKVDPKTLKDEYVDENLMQGLRTVGRDIGAAASTVYKDVKSAIANRYQKFKDHQKARSMGFDLKKGRISPSGVYSKTSPGGGFMNYDLRFDTDLFDLVKGDLINEGLTDSEASRMMLEMHEEITFLYNLSESDKEELNELLGGKPGDGYFGHPNLNIKNPLAKKQTKEPVMPNAKGGGLLNKTAGQLGDRKMKYQELMKGM